MPLYEARVSIGRNSKDVTMVAGSLDEAKRHFRRQGRVLSVKKKSGFSTGSGLTPYERYVFLLKLSTMSGSQVPIPKALELIASTFNGNISRVARDMHQKIGTGMKLREVFESEPKSFPPTIVALIKAGLSAGSTSQALRDAAEFEQMILNVQKGSLKEVATGFVYLVVSAGFFWVTMYYFGPLILDNAMFDHPSVNVGWIETTGFIFMWMNFVMLGLFAGLVLFGTVVRRFAPETIDRFIAKIPFYGDLILSKSNYILFHRLANMVSAGVRIEESLVFAEQDCQKGALKEDLGRAIALLNRGGDWAEGMETLDPTDRASLLSATDAKEIATTFRLLGEQFRDLYLARIGILAPIIMSISLLFMVIVNGVLFGITILPTLQLSAGLM